jgi:hypothetical protein
LSIVQQLSNFENPHYADRTDTIENKPVVVTDSVKLYKNLDSLVTVNTKVINDLTDYVLNMDAKEIKSMADIARLIGAAANGLGDSTKKK